MSQLKIAKVLDAGELCWGVVLLDDYGNPVLRSVKGVNKRDVTVMVKRLKFEGPGAAVSEERDRHVDQPTWIIEKTPEGWAVWFTPVAESIFDLLLKPEATSEPPKVAVEAVESVKKCLLDVEVAWDPPDADPAFDDKQEDETEIEGLPGSGPRVGVAMRQKLDEFSEWTLTQIPVLEGPVLLIIDYSPSAEERPLSIALDYGGGQKCWMTATQVRKIGGEAPRPYEKYRTFTWNGREFNPFSIKVLPHSVFSDINALKGVCRRLYQHVVWA